MVFTSTRAIIFESDIMFSLPSVHTRAFYLNSRCCTRKDLHLFTFTLDGIRPHTHAIQGFEIFLRRATFRNTEYALRAPNTTLVWSEFGETSSVFTIPDGTYTAEELAIELQNGFISSGTQSYSVTYNAPTRTYTITRNTGSKTFRVIVGGFESTSLQDAIGFTTTTQFLDEVTSDSQIKIGGAESLDILVDVPLSTYNNSRFTHKLAEIPLVNTSSNDNLLVNYVNDVYLPMYVNGFIPDTLTFALIDNDGVFYELPLNTDLRLELWITTVYEEPYRIPYS